MKKVLLFLVLLTSSGLGAQTDTSGITFIARPDSTGLGTPDGKLISREIDAAGGTIASEDGRIELIFPGGALATPTTISIQPVTNTLNGSGKAYQLGPSGTLFKKPVTLIFHYTDEEAEICPPDLKRFALQDHKGKWSFFDYEEWDSATKELRGLVHHFSALVTDQNDILLLPEKENVPVNGNMNIWILHKNLIDTGDFKGDHEFADLDSRDKPGAFVNGVFKGNRLTGTAAVHIMQGIGSSIRYNAPEYLPLKNPVEIKLAFTYFSRIKKRVVWGSSKCKINIYDQYRINVTVKWHLLCSSEFIDSSSFVSTVYPKRVEITDVRNHPPGSTSQSKCREFTYVTTGCAGPVNINGQLVVNYAMSNDNPPEVKFEFSRVEVLLLKTIVTAGGISMPPIEHFGPSLPSGIHFRANGMPQTMSCPEVQGVISCEVVINPVRQ